MIDMRIFFLILQAELFSTQECWKICKEKRNFDYKCLLFSFCQFKFLNLNINTKGENCMEFFQ